jgi:hypothetical protein
VDGKGRRSLTRMLSKSSEAGDRSAVILFTVVSEPSEEDGTCEDIGVAEIDLGSIAKSGGDLEDCSLDVYDLEGGEEDVEDSLVGTLTISVGASNVLKALRLE